MLIAGILLICESHDEVSRAVFMIGNDFALTEMVFYYTVATMLAGDDKLWKWLEVKLPFNSDTTNKDKAKISGTSEKRNIICIPDECQNVPWTK